MFLQPDHDPALQEFSRFVSERCQRGIVAPEVDADPHFLPYPDLEEYFADTSRLRKILQSVLPSHGPPRVSFSTIQNGYTKIFSILLLIRRGNFIGYFVEHDSLSDKMLPFEGRPPRFPNDRPDFFDSFCDNQWMFCTPMLRFERSKNWPARTILPIISKEMIGGGGTAGAQKIQVHHAYNLLRDDDGAKSDPFDPLYNTFVLKSFDHDDAADQCKKEVDAFVYLRSSITGRSETGIIRFYGSNVHGRAFNILLEYANEGCLEDYFRNIPPPSGPDRYKFWKGLLPPIRALSRIHNLEFHDSTHQVWHQDVKPDNILVCRRGETLYDCDFKLADLGLSHFPAKSGENVRDQDTRGTRTYNAPERYRPNTITEVGGRNVMSSIDIWSLGCVFSEAAVWSIYGVEGPSGLQSYRERRIEETKGFPSSRDEGYFHDGQGVLASVMATHRNLSEETPQYDTITGALLSMINDMLLPSRDRPNANYLWAKSVMILDGHINMLNGPQLGEPTARSTFRRPPAPLRAEATHPQTADSNSKISISPVSVVVPPSPGDLPEGGTQELSSEQTMFMSTPVQSQTDHPGFPGHRQNSTRSIQFSNVHLPSHSDSKFLRQTKHERKDWFGEIIPTAELLNNGNGTMQLSLSDPAITNTGYLSPYGTATTRPQENPRYTPPIPAEPTHNIQPRGPPFNGCHPTGNPHNGPFNAIPVVAARRVSMPAWPVGESIMWRSRRRTGKNDPLRDDYLEAKLKDRDHVFLLDDSTSMQQHWTDVVRLLDTLAYIVKRSDPNGVDLCFTISDTKATSKNTTDLVWIAGQQRPSNGSRRLSDIDVRLGPILQQYQTRMEANPHSTEKSFSLSSLGLRHSSKEIRKMSIYIFTDGAWQPKSEAESSIRNLVSTLDSQRRPKNQVGVQFIRFGNDQEGFAKLERLDRLGLVRDIVDTEPFQNGNTWKMLLGAIDPWFDDDDTPPSSTVELPASSWGLRKI